MRGQKYLLFKTFVPFVLGFLIIGITSFLSLDTMYVKYQNIRTQEINHNIKNIYKNKINDNNKLYKELILNIQKDTNISNAFLQQDRKKLFLLTKDLYKRLNKKFGITHFYFHGLDEKIFLRVHNPKKHSDTINRFTLNNSTLTNKDSYGIEFGISHNLTNRFVSPYYINSKIVGYLELGEEIDYLTPYLSNVLNAEILIAIEKNLINLEKLKLKSNSNIKIKEYRETNDYYIINSTIKYMNKDLVNLIDGYLNLQTTQEKSKSEYQIGVMKLYDIQKNEVGKIIALTNLEKDQMSLAKYQFLLSVFLFMIAFVIISIYYFFLEDVTTKLNESTKELIELSKIDQLTKLYNRRHFNEQLPIELKKSIRNENYVSFLMIDIDSFKLYNDNYGHLKGDIVLEKISKVLLDSLKRSSDIAFRMGGEEFSIFISEEKGKTSAPIIAQKLIDRINKLNIEHKYTKNKKVSVSIGISTKKASQGLDIDTLYKEADIALYEAKNSGKNRLVIYKEKATCK